MQANEQTLQALNDFGQNVVNDARKELAARQKKKSYRASWNKDGSLKSFNVTVKRYVPDSSGDLSRSLRYEIVEVMGNTLVTFYADDYWYYVNFGRKPGKGMPVAELQDWIRKKPIKLQKGGGAGFAKQTDKGRRALGFLINRKIRTFGIEGNSFFTKTVSIYEDDLVENLGKKVAKDIIKQIAAWPLA